MKRLTPETLAEWRKDACTERTVWGKSNDQRRILALLDALAAEKAAREEAERELADLRARIEALPNALAAAATHDGLDMPGDDYEDGLVVRLAEAQQIVRAALSPEGQIITGRRANPYRK